MKAQVRLTGGAEVNPGDTVSGTVAVDNSSGGPVRLRLRLDDLTPGAAVTVDPPVVDAPAGTSEIPFTLAFAPGTELGVSGGVLRVVDDADPDRVLGERLLSIEVAPVPTLFEEFFWMWVLVAVIVLGVAAYLGAKAWRRVDAARVRGLRAQLWRDDLLLSEVTPRSPRARVFAFVVHEDFTGPQLQPAGPEEANAYVVRRSSGTLRLAAHGQHPAPLGVGERRAIVGGLALSVVDDRGADARSGPRSTRSPPPSRPPTRTPTATRSRRPRPTATRSAARRPPRSPTRPPNPANSTAVCPPPSPTWTPTTRSADRRTPTAGGEQDRMSGRGLGIGRRDQERKPAPRAARSSGRAR
ncbi:hypothetical protein ACFQV2_03660 [Actinokineospora soli]|uniref:GAE domain-containing protein n=1 Tax=Actinokineospora soli TaxID=1048753 RepID=A0ABW2TIR0_9PSEU